MPQDHDDDRPTSGVRSDWRAPRVGVTGHRPNRLGAADLPLLGRRIGEVLAAVEATNDAEPSDGTEGRRARLTVVASLAEGADRLAAAEAVRAGQDLICVLPFRRDEFARDFATAASRAEYETLLGQAREVVELAGSRASPEDERTAYAAAGETILAAADLLLAVWDGGRSQGHGGTVHVLQVAIARGLPVVWIAAAAPHAGRILSRGTGRTPHDRRLDRVEALLDGVPVAGV